MASPYHIFGDNVIEAEWFRALTPMLSEAAYRPILARGSNPPPVDDLIRYDRPDIVLTYRDKPVLVVEKTREVPTGHNVGQRLARVVRAAEAGVPVIAFFPFDARKHGDYSSLCNLNIRLLLAFERMAEIHEVPVLAVNWYVDSFGELVDDGTEDNEMRLLVDEYLRSGHLAANGEFARVAAEMRAEYKVRLRAFRAYGQPPGSVKIVATSTLPSARWTAGRAEEAAFLGRGNSLIYRIGMKPGKARREDPYTGTQFLYDYAYCRNGSDTSEKHTNLVLWFPHIRRDVFRSLNPNDATRKSSNWYLTASAMHFEDGLEVLA